MFSLERILSYPLLATIPFLLNNSHEVNVTCNDSVSTLF